MYIRELISTEFKIYILNICFATSLINSQMSFLTYFKIFNMNKNLFSIITISYNSERTIERTLQSILSQTFTNYEYIIIDGASSDQTLDIIKKYEPLFKGRMKWKSESDKGIYNAMNKGIKCSNGKVIGICNSDDWLEPNALEILDKYIEENQIDVESEAVLSGWMIFHYEDGSSQIIRKYPERLHTE